jgi:ketosteroid isomerase-like protein
VRLLLVEHDTAVRDLLQVFLTREGYAVALASTPPEALGLLEEQTFHLILTDLFKTIEQDPFHAVELLRDRAHPIPVGLITGWKVEEEEVKQRGFACLMYKPFDLDDLLTKVAACLNSPFSPERTRQAQVVQAYFAALTARDWDALLACCREDVLYYLPGDSSFAGTIRGKAAFRAYTEETFRHFPQARFEEVLVYSRPRGLAARYQSRWPTSEGREERVADTVLFEFVGEQIVQIGIQLGDKQRRVLQAYSESPGG